MPRVQVQRIATLPHGGRVFLECEDLQAGPITVWVLESQVSADEARALAADMQRDVDAALRGMAAGPDAR